MDPVSVRRSTVPVPFLRTDGSSEDVEGWLNGETSDMKGQERRTDPGDERFWEVDEGEKERRQEERKVRVEGL